MTYLDTDLNEIITKGKDQGFLTYDEVNHYLPDEDVNPEKLDNLLFALDEKGIKLVEEAPKPEFEEVRPGPTAQQVQAATEQKAAEPLGPAEELRKMDSDPIRMYLSQMAEIPLLSREEEISLAKKIEVSRKRFRRTLLSSDFALK